MSNSASLRKRVASPTRDAVEAAISKLRSKIAPDAVERVGARAKSVEPMELLRTAIETITTAGAELRRILARASELTVRIASSSDVEAQKELIRAHLVATVADERERKKDDKAVDQWLDLEALLDREARRASGYMHETTVGLELAGAMAARLDADAMLLIAQDTAVDSVLSVLGEEARTSPRDLVRGEAYAALARFARRFAELQTLMPRRIVELADATLGDDQTSTEIQIRALEMLVAADYRRGTEVALTRLRRRGTGDDFLVRRNALRFASRFIELRELREVMTDPSEHVRQELARQLGQIGTLGALNMLGDLCRRDTAERVRAFGLRELVAVSRRNQLGPVILSGVLRDQFANEKSSLVMRVVLPELPELTAPPDRLVDPSSLVPVLETMCTRGADATMAELAANALLGIAILETKEGRESVALVRAAWATLRETKSVALAIEPTPENEEMVARALRYVARGDFAAHVERTRRGIRIRRGDRHKRRLWRVIHEIRNPTPDKRAGYWHTIARVVDGTSLVPPVGMAEVTPTRVPGERHVIREVGGWGPYLPRIEDLLAACERAEPIRLFTSAGVTEILPPATPTGRIRARIALTWRYADFATLRDDSLGSKEPTQQRAFLERVASLGFRISLAGEKGAANGREFAVSLSTATAFFQTNAWFFPMFLEDLRSYTLTDSGNPPLHLALVAFCILAFTIVRAAWIQQQVDKAVAGVPLTIGGWGTRGKSGTERLKAGLFHGLGYDVTVKTTGCEAMFIHGVPGREATEIFIYRAYDKATIWEQRDVLELASRLRTQVFLWECMALRPRFVRILNEEWMRGDLATLTNAYPDHEDVMGPSGEDVARVIALFMPKGGRVTTTEEQMLPVLKEHATNLGADLGVVGPLEADLIPIDLVRRFPYEEHPRNIALVGRLAEDLGIDLERAIVLMADFVVTDLGALKTSPRTRHRGRAIEFSNGMSANERAGCMSCWTRLEFDKHNPDEQPDVAIATVVNNRADRVPRSRVFARIVVRDCAAHSHVLIGTNLSGLYRFIGEELEQYLAAAWVMEEGAAFDDEQRTRGLERFDEAMRRVKLQSTGERALRTSIERMVRAVPITDDAVREAMDGLELTPEKVDPPTIRAKLEAALANSPPTEDGDDIREDIAASAETTARRYKQMWEARTKIAAAPTQAEGNAIFRDVYRTLFLETVHIVQDSGSTGDQVVDTVVRTMAPGMRIRLMGIQNIKGTGLDFVYRWVSLDRVHQEIRRLEIPKFRADALTWLASYAGYGLLDCRDALRAVRAYIETKPDAYAETKDAADAAVSRLADLEKKLLAKVAEKKQKKAYETLLNKIEPWLDVLDAIGRRHNARKVINALTSQRIGHNKAAELMRELTKRDKGGWLVKMVAGK